ncbi:hypothetical protein B0H14DRAFT_3658895 [Mycena olivaceomarginata]|nr:hypothetical protein B0H14DRAFT_3658895 [Mycena olivaceomarginata]
MRPAASLHPRRDQLAPRAPARAHGPLAATSQGGSVLLNWKGSCILRLVVPPRDVYLAWLSIKKRNRHSEILLRDFEHVATLASLTGKKKYVYRKHVRRGVGEATTSSPGLGIGTVPVWYGDTSGVLGTARHRIGERCGLRDDHLDVVAWFGSIGTAVDRLGMKLEYSENPYEGSQQLKQSKCSVRTVPWSQVSLRILPYRRLPYAVWPVFDPVPYTMQCVNELHRGMVYDDAEAFYAEVRAAGRGDARRCAGCSARRTRTHGEESSSEADSEADPDDGTLYIPVQ